MIRPTRRSPVSSRTQTAKRMCPAASMRKSPAMTALSSRTRLTARLSGTNHSFRRSTISSSARQPSTRMRAEVTRTPGAAANQSAGKAEKRVPSNGLSDTPSPIRV